MHIGMSSSMMGNHETFCCIEAISRQYFHCLGLGSKSYFLGLGSSLVISVSALVWVLPLLSWSCVSRTSQFKTPDDWWHTSFKTHCRYQLVDAKRFCHLIQLHSFWSRPSFSACCWSEMDDTYLWRHLCACQNGFLICDGKSVNAVC